MRYINCTGSSLGLFRCDRFLETLEEKMIIESNNRLQATAHKPSAMQSFSLAAKVYSTAVGRRLNRDVG